MAIWRVRARLEGILRVPDRLFSKMPAFDGSSLVNKWRECEVEVQGERTEFMYFWAGVLACHRALADLLASRCGGEIELLPIRANGESFRVINVVNVVDCLPRST